MATVTPRLELSKTDPTRGTIYYRLHKGHARRMEFSSKLHLHATHWDPIHRTIRPEAPGAPRLQAQLRADLDLLNHIIATDPEGTLTMGDIIALFKRRRQMV